MSKKILVIDDEVELVGTLQAVLGQRGYTVLTALDGNEGLVLFQRERPDLVITDLNMPTIDGWRVCQRIKNNPVGAEIPVIMLSALVESTQNPNEMEIGDSYISKPFKMTELLSEVRRLLREG
jgi:two-component system alkaline phosphatase synthesis response regulator PhoP